MSWLPSREVDQMIFPLRPLTTACIFANSSASGLPGLPLGGPAKAVPISRREARVRARFIAGNPFRKGGRSGEARTQGSGLPETGSGSLDGDGRGGGGDLVRLVGAVLHHADADGGVSGE